MALNINLRLYLGLNGKYFSKYCSQGHWLVIWLILIAVCQKLKLPHYVLETFSDLSHVKLDNGNSAGF